MTGATADGAGTGLPPLAERRAALSATFGPWRPRTLQQLLDHVAERNPDRPYAITDEVTLSYEDHSEFVALKFGISRAGATAVPIDHCRERLARFKVPAHVMALTVGEIPTTAGGRPRKFLLAEMAAERLIGG